MAVRVCLLIKGNLDWLFDSTTIMRGSSKMIADRVILEKSITLYIRDI